MRVIGDGLGAVQPRQEGTHIWTFLHGTLSVLLAFASDKLS